MLRACCWDWGAAQAEEEALLDRALETCFVLPGSRLEGGRLNAMAVAAAAPRAPAAAAPSRGRALRDNNDDDKGDKSQPLLSGTSSSAHKYPMDGSDGAGVRHALPLGMRVGKWLRSRTRGLCSGTAAKHTNPPTADKLSALAEMTMADVNEVLEADPCCGVYVGVFQSPAADREALVRVQAFLTRLPRGSCASVLFLSKLTQPEAQAVLDMLNPANSPSASERAAEGFADVNVFSADVRVENDSRQLLDLVDTCLVHARMIVVLSAYGFLG